MTPIFADSFYYVALLLQADQSHQRAIFSSPATEADRSSYSTVTDLAKFRGTQIKIIAPWAVPCDKLEPYGKDDNHETKGCQTRREKTAEPQGSSRQSQWAANGPDE